jgi:hypothetical protein
MSTSEELIPRPTVIRERLARSLRETKLLKRLLRLSVEAAEERHQESASVPRQETAGRDGVQ